jgi:Protein of unknown function (DUF998)
MSAAKTAGICGVAGPILFASVVTVLSVIERDFMTSLGWDPLTAPTRDWPSGLALGPGGVVMTVTFLLCGVLLVVFALGLWRSFHAWRAGKAASLFLAAAGCAMCFLSFATDPTNSAVPATLHGRIHDGAFSVLGAALLLSLAAFGFVFKWRGKWGMAIFSWLTAALTVPSFVVKGIVFYVFLAAFMAWCELTALQLLRLAVGPGKRADLLYLTPPGARTGCFPRDP